MCNLFLPLPPPNPCSLFFICFSHLHFILSVRLPPCSGIFGSKYLPECYFLVDVWPFVVQEPPPLPLRFWAFPKVNGIHSPLQGKGCGCPPPPHLLLVSRFLT
jgi:hypothetical protein